MMKQLFLTVAAASAIVLASGVVHAEQDYDVKNTENLQSHVGFSVLGLHQPIIEEDVKEGILANGYATPSDLNAVESAAGDVTVPQVPVAPVMPEALPAPSAAIDGIQQDAVGNAILELEGLEPAAGVVVDEVIVETPAQAVPQPTTPATAGEQTVVTKYRIFGNTDTGVDPETVLKALEAQQN